MLGSWINKSTVCFLILPQKSSADYLVTAVWEGITKHIYMYNFILVLVDRDGIMQYPVPTSGGKP